jgi:hypothetical protein
MGPRAASHAPHFDSGGEPKLSSGHAGRRRPRCLPPNPLGFNRRRAAFAPLAVASPSTLTNAARSSNANGSRISFRSGPGPSLPAARFRFVTIFWRFAIFVNGAKGDSTSIIEPRLGRSIQNGVCPWPLSRVLSRATAKGERRRRCRRKVGHRAHSTPTSRRWHGLSAGECARTQRPPGRRWSRAPSEGYGRNRRRHHSLPRSHAREPQKKPPPPTAGRPKCVHGDQGGERRGRSRPPPANDRAPRQGTSACALGGRRFCGRCLLGQFLAGAA